ncbi:MAG: NADH-dependent [FeFe] hydrogenase, group A6 [Erysipelotrichaceae bacterium]|nr:NADH-dependent [FeFe] hydrogenase, group A6 [Erysipelotrichaceae bacterium]
MVKLTINNIPCKVKEGTTILEAARSVGIMIPTLCYLKDINKSGACRVCLVEVARARTLLSACTTPVSEGMEVFTNSERALRGRKNSVELIMSNHNKNCLSCKRNQNCELQRLCEELGVRENRFEGEHTKPTFEDASYGIVRDTSKCVLCGRCIETCKKVQGLGILGLENRGFKTIVGPVYNSSFNDVNCMQCGQCVTACPVGALTEKEDIHPVIAALNDPTKTVIVQTAPAVRASLGEEFGMPIGSRVTGKMVAALKACGFDRVYDTNFGADLTIMEEGNELLDRVTNGGVLPMFTSCSPGWIKYIEYQYPELLPHLSTSKSPHMMFGAICKTYWAKNKGIDPKDIYVVSIMPCIAKKSEIQRPECKTGEYVDVDAVLTTRECARLIKMYGVEWDELEDDTFDEDLLGDYTGAAVIFGATGGVMEAALRTVKQKLDGKKLEKVDFTACRGMEGVKEAEIDLNGTKIWIAITSSMTAAKPLLDEVKAGTSKYTFIEVMGCPGGCINGGGQSIVPSRIKNGKLGYGYKELRMKALYDEDELMELRVSSDNEQIQKLYNDFLEAPGSELAEELLHTSYSPKTKFNILG